MKIHAMLTLCAIGLYPIYNKAIGQVTVKGQYRIRTEIRNGLGNLVPRGTSSAAFISHRARVELGYQYRPISFGLSVQDVRVWGQDASSISNSDGSRFMVHEAWAGIDIINKKADSDKQKKNARVWLKIGRQEWVYDDGRVIGNLDWLQQARRHDMALLKTSLGSWEMDMGFAYNQNSDAFNITGNGYIPGNIPAYVKNSLGILTPVPSGLMPLAPGGSANANSTLSGSSVFANPAGTNATTQQYKSFTSIYIARAWATTRLSALFFNDNFGKYKSDSAGSATGGYVYGRRFVSTGASDSYDYTGTRHRYTLGITLKQSIKNSLFDKLDVDASGYYQFGENREGQPLRAYHYAISATGKKGKISITPGYEVLSGNNAIAPSANDNRFDPLYGTPHKFWGYMDYFYAGTGSPSTGLDNAYLKIKYTNRALSIGADIHHFNTNHFMKHSDGRQLDKHIGKELDFQVLYAINKLSSLEIGWSFMFATANMPYAKAQAATDAAAEAFKKTGSWVYAMLKITPDFSQLSSSSKK